MPRQRGVFVPRAKPVNRHWTGVRVQFLALNTGTVAVTLISAVHGRETLMRIRGSLVGHVDGLSAPPLGALIALGLILVPEGTGTTVLWSPLSDEDAPWLWYSSFFLGYEEVVADVIDIPGITSYREVVDSKAMRVVRPDVEVQLVAENLAFMEETPLEHFAYLSSALTAD